MEPSIMRNTYRCYVAGKSGGHIIPALTKAREFLKQDSEHKVIFIATNNALDKKLLRNVESTINVHYFPIKQLPGKKFWLYPLFIYSFVVSFFKSLYLLYTTKPDMIVSMGGLISIPVCWAGLASRIPYQLYELNVIPGKANKLLSRCASTIFICFKQTQNYIKKKCTVVPYPLVKYPIGTINKKISDKQTILIIGGSQGSTFLNTLMHHWVSQQKNTKNIVLMHQTGTKEVQKYKDFYQSLSIDADVFAFESNLGQRYAQADLIICRSGAGTLFEIASMKKQCITIPLPQSITNHQLYNAQAMQEMYSFIHALSQEEITSNQGAFYKFLESMLRMATS